MNALSTFRPAARPTQNAGCHGCTHPTYPAPDPANTEPSHPDNGKSCEGYERPLEWLDERSVDQRSGRATSASIVGSNPASKSLTVVAWPEVKIPLHRQSEASHQSERAILEGFSRDASFVVINTANNAFETVKGAGC